MTSRVGSSAATIGTISLFALLASVVASGAAVAQGATPGSESPAVSDGVTVVAAGDIACSPTEKRPGWCAHGETAALVEQIHPVAVLGLGDLQYWSGTTHDFKTVYDKTWGAFKDITWPVVGNHEDLNRDRGFMKYFAAVPARSGVRGQFRAGWYSFDVGSWHVIAINANCDMGSCGVASRQVKWLRRELASHNGQCTALIMHQPRFSSGVHGDEDRLQSVWAAAVDGGADLVLAGHDHDYERFVPRDADGLPSPTGLTEIVVGTGGADLLPARGSAFDATLITGVHGVLNLTLSSDGWTSKFTSVDGSVLDQVSSSCH